MGENKTTRQLLDGLAQAVMNLDRKGAAALASEAIETGIPPYVIISEGLSKGMEVVGQQFKEGTVFIPEVLVACEAYYAGLNTVRPHLRSEDRQHFIATMVIGTIFGDIHSVGKDVAVPIFEAAGFNVIDLGIAVPDEKFVEAIREHKPQLVGLGTYMTSTFMHTRDTVEAIKAAGLRDQVKIICGGPSVEAGAARKLGADDASDNAWEAVEKMKELVRQLEAERAQVTA